MNLKKIVAGAIAGPLLAASAAAAVAESPLEYEIDGKPFSSELVRAASKGSLSSSEGVVGVLLTPDWTGINEHARLQARKLAQQGAVVLIVDLYGRGIRPQDDSQAHAASAPLLADRMEVRRRMRAALSALQQQLPAGVPVKALGFSFGAMASLELGRGGAALSGVAVVWPVLHNPDAASARHISGPVLVIQGTRDGFSTLAQVQSFAEEMDAAGRRYEIVLFGGVKHGFTIPGLPNRPDHPLATDPAASDATDIRLLQFLLNKG
ncbi:dienelactone hydrolase family protein [Roseateles sp.]|jgi:dienelactone hydrolase|uniref:dienelactone hydrolase family protein n=1 Tax=Roseateles sp. TaxID=1971397 RepID=UPI003BA7164D